MQNERNAKRNWLAVGIVLLTALICVLPFWLQKVHSGHDIFYHSGIIRSMCIAWDNGIFGKRVMKVIAQDCGYGTGLFYSLIPASIVTVLIKIFHLPLFFSIGLVHFVLYSVSGLLFYAFIKRVSSNTKIALLGAIFYLLNPYSINALYVRFSFAESFLLLPISMIFWGLYELLERSNIRRFFLLFTIGFTLAFYLHFMMSVFITVIGCVYIACYFKHVFKSKKIFALLGATACVLLMSCAYYIPMLVNYANVQTDSMASTALEVYLHTLTTPFLSRLTFSVLSGGLVLGFFIRLLCVKKWKNLSKNIRCLFILTATTFGLTTPLFPWCIFPNFVGIIQFPWRIFCINQLFSTISFLYLLKETNKKKLVKILFYSFSTVLSVNFLLHSFIIYGEKTLKRATLTENFVMQPITGMSENLSLGAYKNGDYFPNGTTREYFLHRANKNVLLSCEYDVTEFAHYPTLCQVSFLITPQEKTTVELTIPYSVCEEISVVGLTTKKSEAVSVKTLKSERDTLCIEIDKAEETKIILSYPENGIFEKYLHENPFEFMTVEGNAEYTDFVKKSASEYSVSITSDGATVELPTLYYKGYKITYTVDGEVYELTPTLGENGFITVEIKESGTLNLSFEGKYISVTETLSLISIGVFGVGMLLWLGLEKYKKEN